MQTMTYQIKNYLLSMTSNWPINHALYDAIQESVPAIAKYRASEGKENLGKTAINKMCKQVFPEIYTVPLFRRQWCKMMVEEIKEMEKYVGFRPNNDEDVLRQIPEIVLRDHCPELYSRMWFVVQTVLNPIFLSLYPKGLFRYILGSDRKLQS
jgi:hypothetical protein